MDHLVCWCEDLRTTVQLYANPENIRPRFDDFPPMSIVNYNNQWFIKGDPQTWVSLREQTWVPLRELSIGTSIGEAPEIRISEEDADYIITGEPQLPIFHGTRMQDNTYPYWDWTSDVGWINDVPSIDVIAPLKEERLPSIDPDEWEKLLSEGT